MILVTREILSLSNPSFRNIPNSTIEDTARRVRRFAPRPTKTVRVCTSRAGRRTCRMVQKPLTNRELKARASKARVQRQREERERRQKAFEAAEKKRKEKITRVELEKARTEILTVGGPTKRGLARAKRRRQTRIVERTAARRGRRRKITRKIAGKSCSARFAQDVGALTASEARCELQSKRFDKRTPSTVGGRRIPARRARTVPIKNEREARLIVKLASRRIPGRGRVGRRGGRAPRTVFSSDIGIAGINAGVIAQARAGLAPLDALERSKETITRRIGSKSFPIISVSRRSRLKGTQQNLLRGRANFLFAGGTHSEFDAIVAGDIANRQSGRRDVAAVSRGAVRLNRPVQDPFRGGFARF